MDEVERNNLTIDVRELARELGVPVVPMAARRAEGISELSSAIEKVASNAFPLQARQVHYKDEKLESAIEKLANNLGETFADLPNARWVALRLLEGDESIISAVRNKTLGTLKTGKSLPQMAFSEAR
jgi:ferrous iron transport protein B